MPRKPAAFAAMSVLFFVTAVCLNSAYADEVKRGPSVTLNVTGKSSYVINQGFKLEPGPVIQEDLFISWPSGWYVDIWNCNSVQHFGAKRSDGFGNEFDPIYAGWSGKAGAFRLTGEIAYFDLVDLGKFNDDFWRAKFRVERPFKRLTPYIEIQDLERTGSRSFSPGRLYFGGATTSVHGVDLDAFAIYDDGLAGAEEGFLAHLNVSRNFFSKKLVGLKVGLELSEPVTVTDRDFQWAASCGAVFHLR